MRWPLVIADVGQRRMKMKRLLAIAIAFACAGCQSETPGPDQLIKAAERVQVKHQAWLNERPRKVDDMTLSGKDVPVEFRQLGCDSALVSGDCVILFTNTNSGVVIDTGTNIDMSGFACLGFNVVTTAIPEILTFTFKSITNPAQPTAAASPPEGRQKVDGQ